MRQFLLFSAILSGFFTVNLAVAADNPYTKNYAAEKPIMAKLTPETDAPKIYRGGRVNDDNAQMFSQGYDLIGSSRFVAGEVAPDARRSMPPIR